MGMSSTHTHFLRSTVSASCMQSHSHACAHTHTFAHADENLYVDAHAHAHIYTHSGDYVTRLHVACLIQWHLCVRVCECEYMRVCAKVCIHETYLHVTCLVSAICVCAHARVRVKVRAYMRLTRCIYTCHASHSVPSACASLCICVCV